MCHMEENQERPSEPVPGTGSHYLPGREGEYEPDHHIGIMVGAGTSMRARSWRNGSDFIDIIELPHDTNLHIFGSDDEKLETVARLIAAATTIQDHIRDRIAARLAASTCPDDQPGEMALPA